MRSILWPTVSLLGLLLTSGCTVEDGTPTRETSTNEVEDPDPSADTNGGSDTAASDTANSSAGADPDRSVGLLTLGDELIDLHFDCFAPGAGEVLATGASTDVITGERTEVYVQAFLGSPYLGVSRTSSGENPRFLEPELGPELVVDYRDDVIRVTDVALVADLDLESGEATPAGMASLVVECRTYSESLPEGFGTG